MALGEDDKAMSDFNQAASLNKSKDLFTLVSVLFYLTYEPSGIRLFVVLLELQPRLVQDLVLGLGDVAHREQYSVIR